MPSERERLVGKIERLESRLRIESACLRDSTEALARWIDGVRDVEELLAIRRAELAAFDKEHPDATD